MDINRLKQLSGVVAKAEAVKDQAVTESFSGIKMVQEAGFRLLAKHFGATEIKLNESGLYTTAKVTFKESDRDQSVEKMNDFKNAWKFYSATGNLQESYKIAPAVNSDEFPPINGLEGPFRYESGKVLYYAPKVGKYYDSKTDTYLDPEEVEYHRNPRVNESESLELLEAKMTAAQKAKREEIVMSMKDKADEFKKKYGADWKSVMYATATKQALGEAMAEGESEDCVPVSEGEKWVLYVGKKGSGKLSPQFSGDSKGECEQEFKDSWKNDTDENGKVVKYSHKTIKVSDGNEAPKTLNEDHGEGFYVMVDGKEHCWCKTEDEAKEKAEKLKDDGKNVKVVPDKELKEECDEEEGDSYKSSEEKSKKDSEEKEAEEVKEAVVDNFVQDDTDAKNALVTRTGTEAMMNKKITVPAKVKSAVDARIAELKKSIEIYDEKGYNDHSQKEKAIECLQKIMDDLSLNNLEALKKAQIFYGTLMSPITDLIPAQLVNFLATAEAVKEQEDKDRASVVKRHIAHHEEQMGRLDKDSTSYKDHAKALERYKKELAQYE